MTCQACGTLKTHLHINGERHAFQGTKHFIYHLYCRQWVRPLLVWQWTAQLGQIQAPPRLASDEARQPLVKPQKA